MRHQFRQLQTAFQADPDGRGSIASNGTWASVQQLVNVGSQAFTSFLLVLVLSVDDFGVYSYAVVMTSIGINLMSAGLSGLAIKVLVQGENQTARLVSTILLIREAMALVAYGVLAAVSFTSGSSVTTAATLVAALALFARAGDAPEFWFKAELRTRTPALIRIVVTLGCLSIRLVAMLFTSSLMFFLTLYVLEALIAGLWVVLRYKRERRSEAFARPRVATVVALTRQSFPLFLSATANQVNLRGDVVFIQAFLGSTSVGIYSAAARLSEVAYFLPTVFMDATLPSLVRLHEAHGEDSDEFRSVMQRSYDRAFWTGVLVAVAIGALGTSVISLFLDPVYRESILLLWVSLISCPFIFMAAVYSKWILTLNTLWSSVVRHSLGALLNIGLNLYLIPRIGLIGASIASVSSYITASYLASFVGRRTRIAGWQMTLALVAPLRYVAGRWGPKPESKDV